MNHQNYMNSILKGAELLLAAVDNEGFRSMIADEPAPVVEPPYSSMASRQWTNRLHLMVYQYMGEKVGLLKAVTESEDGFTSEHFDETSDMQRALHEASMEKVADMLRSQVMNAALAHATVEQQWLGVVGTCRAIVHATREHIAGQHQGQTH